MSDKNTVNVPETGTIGPCMSSMNYKKKKFKFKNLQDESGFFTTSQDELLVVFGGKIILGGASYVDKDGWVYGELVMGEDGNSYKIGEDLGKQTNEEFFNYHPVRLRFPSDSSIDVLIEQLQEIKKLMNKHEW